ncbi:MAG: NAD(P)-dependent oxidoreductase [Deltaproteobacteria bacterium]|nr:NAD(P)-dependent oxidoreductase [Deltaproteobacteria bacterium]
MKIEKVSVIGLGLMGSALATLLMRAGYQVSGFDIIPKQMTRLTSLGLRTVHSPREGARGADLILLSLPSWSAVLQAMEGEGGVMEEVKKGQIVVDTSTSPPLESKALGERLAKKGIAWMDVPISGSSQQAREGNMVFMAGGDKTVFNRIRPILDQIGKKTVYAGKSGEGATLKLVINHTLYLNQAAAIEGLVLGLKAGLDPDVLLDAMTSGAASSDLLISRGKDMLQGEFSAKGPLFVANKDLALSLEMARQCGVVLPVGALYQQFLLKAHYNGWDREDATSVMKIYQGLAERAGDAHPSLRKGRSSS